MVNFVMDTEFIGAERKTVEEAVADIDTHIATLDNTHTVFVAKVIDVFNGQLFKGYVVSGV